MAAQTAAPPAAHAADPSGPVLFARYAFGPNRLGLCGSEAVDELFASAAVRPDERALRELARSFEGAWPYLELIAHSNGIADPLDRRVVDAYWLGSCLLEVVTPRTLGESLESRFRPRARRADWPWLGGKAVTGGAPVHAFHVLDVYPRVGLLRSGSIDSMLDMMDACRIRWGRILERDGTALVVNVVPLELRNGRLALGPARAERIDAWRDGAAFIEDADIGDVVSVHWSWACDRLTPARLTDLICWTQRQIDVANRTI